MYAPNFPARDTRMKEKDKKALLARLEVDRGQEKQEISNVSWTKVLFNYKIWLL
jgi:hypothetical protein